MIGKKERSLESCLKLSFYCSACALMILYHQNASRHQQCDLDLRSTHFDIIHVIAAGHQQYKRMSYHNVGNIFFVCLFASLLTVLVVGDTRQVMEESSSTTPSYRAEDDASWAIHSKGLSLTKIGPHRKASYDEFIANCLKTLKESSYEQELGENICIDDEKYRMYMNNYQPPSMRNFTKLGYEKIKAPKKLFDLISAFYKTNRHRDEIEWPKLNSYHNDWESQCTIIHLNKRENPGGGPHLQVVLFEEAKKVLEAWTGQELLPVSLYGVRIYHNKAILAPHVDRTPLVISAIINVDQNVNEPWPLEVYGHDGYAVNITMEPGDMILYESHSVIHGRPFPLNGSHYANVFVHFEPIGPKDDFANGVYDPEEDLPPYYLIPIQTNNHTPAVIPESTWQAIWDQENPKGWFDETFDARTAATRGDMTALKLVAKYFPQDFEEADDLGWSAIHEATRSGKVPAVQLILENGIDINKKTLTGVSPLNIAMEYLGRDHEMTKFLLEKGAVDIDEWVEL